MKVGVLGSGDIATTRASGFPNHGHLVMTGTRDPPKFDAWMAENRKAQIGNFAEAVRFAQLVELAAKGQCPG